MSDPEFEQKIADAKQRIKDFSAHPEIVENAENFLREHGVELEHLAKKQAAKKHSAKKA